MPAAALPPLATASAGALGAATSNALIFPLDLITSRLQTQNSRGKNKYTSPGQAARKIVRTEGVSGLYAGLSSDTLSTLLSNFSFFIAYSSIQTAVAKRRQQTSGKATEAKLLSATEEIFIGWVSGVFSKALTTPLSVVTVRKQTSAKPLETPSTTPLPTPIDEHPRRRRATSDAAEEDFGGAATTLEVARQLYREEGIAAFWSGFPEAALLSINPAITMYLLELFKRILLPAGHQAKPSPLEVFGTSALASSLAVTLCYPAMLAKSRLQSGRFHYDNIFAAFRSIVRRNGWQGLFAGWQSQILKSTLQLGLSMTLKARVELLIVALLRRAQQQKAVRLAR